MAELDIKDALIEIRTIYHIKRATADFSRSYIAIVRKYFPDIIITGDKFHFFQKIQGILDKTRRHIAKALVTEQADRIWLALNIKTPQQQPEAVQRAVQKKAKKQSVAKLLNDDAKLFKTRFVKLDLGQKARLDIWRKMIHQIKVRHQLLQRLYSLFNRRDLKPKKRLQRYCKILYQFQSDSHYQFSKFKTFLSKNHQAIVAYFETDETNALAESMNSQIREIILIARGGHTSGNFPPYVRQVWVCRARVRVRFNDCKYFVDTGESIMCVDENYQSIPSGARVEAWYPSPQKWPFKKSEESSNPQIPFP